MLVFSSRKRKDRLQGLQYFVQSRGKVGHREEQVLMASAARIKVPLKFNEDGSTIRVPYSPVPPNPNFEDGVASADVNLGAIWVRVFCPEQGKKNKLNSDEEQEAKPTSDEEQKDNRQEMPVVVYFHGGGFVMGGASLAEFQTWCGQICKKLDAVVVSVNYRLAPENRLPAAYDDGFSVLTWLQKIATKQEALRPDDPPVHSWLRCCDFSRVFLMGDSAGGNLAHHVTVRAAQNPDVLQPVKVVGQVLIQPFFGGMARTDSEVRLAQGAIITTALCDLCWSLCLPESAAGNLDHPFSNQALHFPQTLKHLDSFPKTLVVIGGLDLLQDRQVEYADILKQAGKAATLAVHQDADHAFYIVPDSKETLQLLDEMAAFCSD